MADEVMDYRNLFAQVGADGRLVLPPEVAARYGIAPGVRVRVDEIASGLKLLRPSRLMKLYIEPTNQCNLDCRTCMRNVWEEPLGMMPDAVFDRIIEGLKAFSPLSLSEIMGLLYHRFGDLFLTFEIPAEW